VDNRQPIQLLAKATSHSPLYFSLHTRHFFIFVHITQPSHYPPIFPLRNHSHSFTHLTPFLFSLVFTLPVCLAHRGHHFSFIHSLSFSPLSPSLPRAHPACITHNYPSTCTPRTRVCAFLSRALTSITLPINVCTGHTHTRTFASKFLFWSFVLSEVSCVQELSPCKSFIVESSECLFGSFSVATRAPSTTLTCPGRGSFVPTLVLHVPVLDDTHKYTRTRNKYLCCSALGRRPHTEPFLSLEHFLLDRSHRPAVSSFVKTVTPPTVKT
jgi:hypothetical protein